MDNGTANVFVHFVSLKTLEYCLNTLILLSQCPFISIMKNYAMDCIQIVLLNVTLASAFLKSSFEANNISVFSWLPLE